MIDRHGAVEDGWQALCGEEGGGRESRPQSSPPLSNRETLRDAAGKTRRFPLSPVLEKKEKGVTHDTAASPPLQAIREVRVLFRLNRAFKEP
jgi:hypothetical protein